MRLVFPRFLERYCRTQINHLAGNRLENVERKLSRNETLRGEYNGFAEEQLRAGIIEEVPQNSTTERVFYMPHKPVVKQSAVTKKNSFGV